MSFQLEFWVPATATQPTGDEISAWMGEYRGMALAEDDGGELRTWQFEGPDTQIWYRVLQHPPRAQAEPGWQSLGVWMELPVAEGDLASRVAPTALEFARRFCDRFLCRITHTNSDQTAPIPLDDAEVDSAYLAWDESVARTIQVVLARRRLFARGALAVFVALLLLFYVQLFLMGSLFAGK